MKTSKFAFPNGLVQKFQIDLSFGFRQIWPRKSIWFLDRKQAVLVFKNTDLKKPENLHLCKEVSPSFW